MRTEAYDGGSFFSTNPDYVGWRDEVPASIGLRVGVSILLVTLLLSLSGNLGDRSQSDRCLARAIE